MVALQHGRYLLSNLRRMRSSRRPLSAGDWASWLAHLVRLESSPTGTVRQPLFVDGHLSLEAATSVLDQVAHKHTEQTLLMHDAAAQRCSAEEAWNSNAPMILECSRLNTMQYVNHQFRQLLLTVEHAGAAEQLLQLFRLSLSQWLLADLSLLLQYGAVSASDAATLRTYYALQCTRVRPYALQLTEAFGYPDWSYRSVFATADTQAMYQGQSPLPLLVSNFFLWSACMMPVMVCLRMGVLATVNFETNYNGAIS